MLIPTPVNTTTNTLGGIKVTNISYFLIRGNIGATTWAFYNISNGSRADAFRTTTNSGTISGGTLTNGIYSGADFTQDANQAIGTVTIDSTNNSLQGIRDAINAAGKGVTAAIVGDGSC